MDLGWLASWLDSANGFFQDAWNFVDNGIYTLFKDGLVLLTKALIYSFIEFKIFMLQVAYDAVSQILTDTGVVAMVQSMWGHVPGDIQSILAFFNIPQGLSLIFAAIPTRWALKFIPGMGN